MSFNTKNYMGAEDEWVIGGTLKIEAGGKLVVEPGAAVEGSASAASVKALPNSESTTVAKLREDFNALLQALRDAGVMQGGGGE